MQQKAIQLREGIWINVPDDLTPAQQTRLVANLDPAVLEAECKEILQMHEEGRLIPFEAVLADLLKDLPDNGQPK